MIPPNMPGYFFPSQKPTIRITIVQKIPVIESDMVCSYATVFTR
jgi:hypothetical protein